MVKRRSFDDAMTADEEVFFKQGRAKPAAGKPKPKSTPKSQPKQEEPKMSKPALKRHVAEEFPTAIIPPEPAAAPLKISNLSVRIDSRIAASLLRAMTERRIEGATPATQQDIVADAMVDWLKKHGYFR